MPDYDFKSLSPIDFEVLVRDLLQLEFGVHFESFRPGRDKGIDFRHSPASGKSWIIQCKHYAGSGFPKLLSMLKDEELEKVKKLKPERYILATSLGLTPGDKEKLLDVFADINLAQGDIFGREDLNNLLGRYPQIEQGNLKLWLSSTTVLERLLHSATINLTEDTVQRIIKQAKLYVHNESFPKALELLKSGNICIICGIPGIGKTTLAEMLVLFFIHHEYEIVRVTEDIREAYGLKHHERPRFYYYDDFLGRTALGDKLRKNEDQRLSEFVQSIRKSKNSKLVLTTREYILNQASREYERLADWVTTNYTYVLDLSKYSRRIKAQILINHIYFSDLPRPYVDALVSHPDFLTLIDHDNYNPRLVEFMTDFGRLRHVPADEYFSAFRASFDNPSKLWEHAYKDISFSAKNLVLVLFTLPTNTLLQDLKRAFLRFHAFRCEKNRVTIADTDFEDALKETDGNFTTSAKPASGFRISFHNPSVADFVREFLRSQPQVLETVVESLYFPDQLDMLWNYRIGKDEHPIYRALILSQAGLIETAVKNVIDFGVKSKDRGERHESLTNRSPESVGRVIAGILKDKRSPELNTAFDELLNCILPRIDSEEAADIELVHLAKAMRKSALIDNQFREDFRLRIESHLHREYDDWRRCEELIAFMETFSEFYDEGKRERVRSIFEAALEKRGAFEDLPEDPDEVRGEADRLTEIAEFLAIDVTEHLEQYERIAQEMLPRLERDEDWDSGRGGGGYTYDYCNDGEIRSMFGTLRG